MDTHKLYSDSEHLSNVELFYSKAENFKDNAVVLEGDEFHHAVKVMRHHPGDELFITNGEGKISSGIISEIKKDFLSIEISKNINYKNKYSAITFCIPKLKNPERFEFALEKCTELGITNFIVFESDRTVSKSHKIERWQKILLSAMKQSLRSFLPSLSIANSVEEIKKLVGKKIVFEQNALNKFNGIPAGSFDMHYFLFGPEGGLSQREIDLFHQDEHFKLADNRLRSETAIIKCASILIL